MGLLLSRPAIFLFTAGVAVLAVMLKMQYDRSTNGSTTRFLVNLTALVALIVALIAFFGIFRLSVVRE
jgi:hypothetical protein